MRCKAASSFLNARLPARWKRLMATRLPVSGAHELAEQAFQRLAPSRESSVEPGVSAAPSYTLAEIPSPSWGPRAYRLRQPVSVPPSSPPRAAVRKAEVLSGTWRSPLGRLAAGKLG